MSKSKKVSSVPTEEQIKPSQEVPVAGETVDELKQPENVTVTAPTVPVIELPPPTGDGTEIIETPKVRDKVLVDKELFYKMFATCVKGSYYIGHAAVTRFGAMLGAKTYDEQKDEWHKAQEYLAKEKK